MRQAILKASTLSGAMIAMLLGASLSWPKVTPVLPSGPSKKTAPQSASPASNSPARAASSPEAASHTVAPAESLGPSGRRDPFKTLIQEKKATSTEPVVYPPGKKGLVIEQIDLRGTARAVDGEWIAVVDNKSKRAYFLHEKDQLFNGVVAKVLPDRIIFQESFNEPLGQTGSREIVKKLSAD